MSFFSSFNVILCKMCIHDRIFFNFLCGIAWSLRSLHAKPQHDSLTYDMYVNVDHIWEQQFQAFQWMQRSLVTIRVDEKKCSFTLKVRTPVLITQVPFFLQWFVCSTKQLEEQKKNSSYGSFWIICSGFPTKLFRGWKFEHYRHASCSSSWLFKGLNML